MSQSSSFVSLDSYPGHGLNSALGPCSATLVPLWAYSPRDAQQTYLDDNIDDQVEMDDNYGEELSVCKVSSKDTYPQQQRQPACMQGPCAGT